MLGAVEYFEQGGYWYGHNRVTGEVQKLAYVPETEVLKAGDRLVQTDTGKILTEAEETWQSDFHIIGRKGDKFFYGLKVPIPKGTYAKPDPNTGYIDFYDKTTNKLVDTYIPGRAATLAEMMEAGARATEAKAKAAEVQAVERVEWEKIKSKERIVDVQVQATLKGQDTQLLIAQGGWEITKYGIDVKAETATALRMSNERIENVKAVLTQKALDIKEKYGLDDLALRKYLGDRGFEIELTSVQAKERVGMARMAMDKYGIDVGAAIAADDRESAKFIALNKMSIQEKIAKEANLKDWQIVQLQVGVDYAQIEATKEGYRIKKEIADAANLTEQQRIKINKYLTEIGLDLQRELGFEKIELDRLLGLLGLEVEKYKAGYVPQTMEDVLELKEGKERIEARYAPLTTPNMMNKEDAEDWRADEAAIEAWLEGAKTDEKIKYWEATREPLDLLKEQAYMVAQSGGLNSLNDWGRYLLGLPEEPIDKKREEDWKYKKMQLWYEYTLNSPKEQREALERIWGDALKFVRQKSGLFTILDPSIQRDEWAATLTIYKGLLMERLGFTSEQADEHTATVASPLAEYVTAPETQLPGQAPRERALSPKLSDLLEGISGKPIRPLTIVPPGAPPTKAGPPTTKDSAWWRDWFVAGFKAGGDARTVKWIQQQLIEEGQTKVQATGVWDKNTERAFRTSWNRGKISQMLKGTVEEGW